MHRHQNKSVCYTHQNNTTHAHTHLLLGGVGDLQGPLEAGEHSGLVPDRCPPLSLWLPVQVAAGQHRLALVRALEQLGAVGGGLVS